MPSRCALVEAKSSTIASDCFKCGYLTKAQAGTSRIPYPSPNPNPNTQIHNLSFMAFVSVEVKTKDCHHPKSGKERERETPATLLLPYILHKINSSLIVQTNTVNYTIQVWYIFI